VLALCHEKLEGDLRAFLNSQALSNLPHLLWAKVGLMSDRPDPLEFFSKEQLRAVNDLFSEEFDTFCYSRA